MGTNVDCYQRAEGRYRLMPGIIAALRAAGAAAGGAGPGGHQAVAAGRQPAQVTREVQLSLL